MDRGQYTLWPLWTEPISGLPTFQNASAAYDNITYPFINQLSECNGNNKMRIKHLKTYRV